MDECVRHLASSLYVDVDREWIRQCIAFVHSSSIVSHANIASEVEKHLLESDWNEIPLSPISPVSDDARILGPVVMQIDELVDVTKSRDQLCSEYSGEKVGELDEFELEFGAASSTLDSDDRGAPTGASRLKLNLYDGKKRYFAFELIPFLARLKLPAGCKIELCNARVHRDLILLEPSCVRVRGGLVAQLLEMEKKSKALLIRLTRGIPNDTEETLDRSSDLPSSNSSRVESSVSTTVVEVVVDTQLSNHSSQPSLSQPMDSARSSLPIKSFLRQILRRKISGNYFVKGRFVRILSIQQRPQDSKWISLVSLGDGSAQVDALCPPSVLMTAVGTIDPSSDKDGAKHALLSIFGIFRISYDSSSPTSQSQPCVRITGFDANEANFYGSTL